MVDWIKNLNNPKDAVVTSLPMLEKTLLSIFKNSKHKWVLMVNPDGMVVPCAVSLVKYKARGRDDDAYVNLSLSFITIRTTNHWSDNER